MASFQALPDAHWYSGCPKWVGEGLFSVETKGKGGEGTNTTAFLFPPPPGGRNGGRRIPSTLAESASTLRVLGMRRCFEESLSTLPPPPFPPVFLFFFIPHPPC